MKAIRQLVFLVIVSAVVVSGFPRERDVESVEDDAEDVPLSEVPAVNVPAGPTFGFIPSYYSFVPNIDLVSRIRELVTRLRSQIGNTFGNIDWNKGNTTSTTKVIEGHVVTVNETSYQDEDSDLVLHVKVIDVKPTEGEAETTENDVPPSAASNEDTERNEDVERNEIPNKPREDVAESLEYEYQPEETREHLVDARDNYLYNDSPVEETENFVEEFKPVSSQLIPLHNDIRVNQIQEDKGEMNELPEDVEIFVPDNRDMYTVNRNNEYVYNPAPVYETVPYARYQYRPWSEKLINFT